MFIVIVPFIATAFLQAVAQAVKEGGAALWGAVWGALGSACPTFGSLNPPEPTVRYFHGSDGGAEA